MNKEEIKQEIQETQDLKEKIVLEGKLITLIKQEIKQETNPSEKNILRLELNKELENHKETIKKRRESNTDKLPISESLALKIKEIATTIDIFKEKHDVIEKLKTAGVSTAISTIMALGLGTAITALSGGTLALPTLASIAPIASYIGLSNLIRMPFQKTGWEEYIKDSKINDEEIKEMKEFNEKYIKNNQELLECIHKSRQTQSVEELTNIVEKIITMYKEIEKKTNIKSCQYVMNAEIVSQMNLLKKCYEQQKKDYIRDKNNMTNQEFIELEKKSLNLDGELLNRNSHIEETGKELGKDIALNTAIMFGTKLCLSTLFPSFAFHSLSDVTVPFILSVLNSITNIDSIKNKIKVKQSKYCGKYISANSSLKEVLDNITKQNETQMSV